jgi:hypothetical protein
MDFEIRRISYCGTKHPVVARLKLQAHELIQWADLPKDKKDAATAIYFSLADRLLKCHELYVRLISEYSSAMSELRPVDDTRVRRVPHLIGLRGDSESFLYEGKNFLRDLLGVTRTFFDSSFEEASVFADFNGSGMSDIARWAGQKFGVLDPLTTMLTVAQDWTSELIAKRNAVEHPAGKSGTLYIENFTVSSSDDVISPRWRRDTSVSIAILPDIEA